MYTIFMLITAKFGMQQKKSARKISKNGKKYLLLQQVLCSVVSKY